MIDHELFEVHIKKKQTVWRQVPFTGEMERAGSQVAEPVIYVVAPSRAVAIAFVEDYWIEKSEGDQIIRCEQKENLHVLVHMK